MNLNGLRAIPVRPLTGQWFRAVQPQFLSGALQASHTATTPSRFNAGGRFGAPQFETLYFAEDIMTALFEISALLGNALAPISNNTLNFAFLTVTVQLSRILDLSDVSAHAHLDTDAQALTGDWRGYASRDPACAVPAPIGIAPTQHLGAAIRYDGRHVEGFISVSSKQPRGRILVLLNENIRSPSVAQYALMDAAGKRTVIKI